MNREHGLVLLVGLLGGFLLGYLAKEQMDGVQPARLAAATGVVPGGPSGPAGPAGPDAAGANPMAEVNRLQQAIAANPEDADSILRLANMSFDIQRWERAGELYERYLALRPGDPDVLTDLGITRRARGDFDGALELFAQAQGIAPDHWQARFNEVIVRAFDQRDLPGATRALAELEARRPGDPDVARLAEEVRRLGAAPAAPTEPGAADSAAAR